MSGEKGPNGDIATGVQSILDRVGEFFHIFDLSFFVAGASTFGALAFLYVMMQKPTTFPIAPWVGVGAVIIACYICGLIVFALGRSLNGVLFRRATLESTLPKALEAHGLKEKSIEAYKPRQTAYLYARMWSEIAQEARGRSASALFQHLMRYWAMAATYDAVAVSFIVWAGVFVLVAFKSVAPQPLGSRLALTVAALCVGAAGFALHRGSVYYRYQIEDVVAHFAVSRGPLVVRNDQRPGNSA